MSQTNQTLPGNAKVELEMLIRQMADGTIFSVRFRKRTTGEMRDMTCRLKVKKGVKGVGHSFNPREKNLLCVYDMQKIEEGKDEKGAFRMINLEDVYWIKIKGQTYTFREE
jgi:hypothetical protein